MLSNSHNGDTAQELSNTNIYLDLVITREGEISRHFSDFLNYANVFEKCKKSLVVCWPLKFHFKEASGLEILLFLSLCGILAAFI